MANEFQMSFSGSSKDLLDAIAILAEQDINLDTVATAKIGENFVIKFLSTSEEKVRRALMKADLEFRDRPVIIVEMFNSPGQWLKVARTIVNSGVEIDSSYLMGQKGDRMSVVFAVSDTDKARAILTRLTELSVH